MNLDYVTYDFYRSSNGGQLSREKFLRIKIYEPSLEDYEKASECMERASKKVKLAQTMDSSNVFIVAKIIGACGQKIPKDARGIEPDELWLLREAYLLQGKNANFINPMLLEGRLNC